MKKDNPLTVFTRSLQKLAYNQSLWTAFNDFLDFTLLFMKWWDRKPEEYNELEKKYPPETYQYFADAYIAVGQIADNGGEGFNDPFGDYFMEHFASERKGQFFTPMEMCEVLALVTGVDKMPDGSTVGDPTCGSGRGLLVAAKYNNRCKFYGADIDLVCCKMTVINFMLNTMVGEVAWMDTIRLTHWKSWHIRRVLNRAGKYVPYYVESGPGETYFISRAPPTEVLDNQPATGKEPVLKSPSKGSFLEFDMEPRAAKPLILESV